MKPDIPQVRRVNVDADIALQLTRRHPLSIEAYLYIQIACPRRFAEKRRQVQLADIHLRLITQRRGQHVGLPSDRHRFLHILTHRVQFDAGDKRLRRPFDVDAEAQLTMQALLL